MAPRILPAAHPHPPNPPPPPPPPPHPQASEAGEERQRQQRRGAGSGGAAIVKERDLLWILRKDPRRHERVRELLEVWEEQKEARVGRQPEDYEKGD